MYYKVTDDELKTLEEVAELTSSDYEIMGNFVPVDKMLDMVKDLICEIHRSDEKIKDMEQDIENNYEVKNIDPYEELGLSRGDF